MALRLPPLNSLRVFEAAARHKSFRKAAEELNLTASAVSHAVQTLETWLGLELFHREPRGLRLTAAGHAYAPLVNQGLALLAKATEEIPGRAPTCTLSVSVAPTFASKILLPRLDRFAARFPDIRLTIDTTMRLVDLTVDEFDLAIRFSTTEKPAPNWTLLMTESLVPVASPQFKRRFGRQPIARILTQAPLIEVTNISADWAYWFRATGMEPANERSLRVDTIQMAFEAAIRGLGVALGRRPLVDDDLEAGRLVALGDEVASDSGYWLVTPPTEYEKPELTLFRDWLVGELGSAERKSKA
jgi:LysR family transcriptional regulator, glycine cleavage system transcriptional activator